MFNRKDAPSSAASVASFSTDHTTLAWVDEEWERSTKSNTYTFADVDKASVLQLEDWGRRMLERVSVVDDSQFTGLRSLQDVASRVHYVRDSVSILIQTFETCLIRPYDG